jgi:hypothetical protein
MLTKLFEMITGKDDLERVAYREDLGQLRAYLKTRRLWIPRRPRRFLDAASFTPEDLLELVRACYELQQKCGAALWSIRKLKAT